MIELKERTVDSTAGASLTTSTTEQTAPGGTRRTRRCLVAALAGITLAGGLWVFAGLMRDNGRFAEGNVARQLSEQTITFKADESLTPEEREHSCLVKYAGQRLQTGLQAACYANHFIGVHLKQIAQGKTYSQMRGVQDSLRAQIAAAQAGNDPVVTDLQRKLAEVTGQRQVLFEGETLRGLLMTSYGFSVLGTKAAQAASAASVLAGGMIVVSMALLVASLATRRS